MRMNKAKITYLFLALFFIFSLNVDAFQTTSLFNETFNSCNDIRIGLSSMTKMYVNTLSGGQALTNCDYSWNVGYWNSTYGTARENNNTYLNITTYFSDWGKSLYIYGFPNSSNVNNMPFIYHDFGSNDWSISNLSYIGIRLKDLHGVYDGNNYGQSPVILLIDDDGNCVLQASTDTSYLPQTFCRDNLRSVNCSALASKQTDTLNKTMYMQANHVNCVYNFLNSNNQNIAHDINFRYVLVSSHQFGSTSGGVVMDNFAIVNLKNGTNQLPYINVSLDHTCFNNTGEIKTVNYNISVYDEENDTVFYNPVTNIISNYMEKQSIYYQSNQLQVYDQDYSFYDNTIKVDQGCEFNLLPWFNQSKFNLQSHYSTENSVLARDPNMLRLSSGCSGRAEYMYQFKQPFGWFHYDTVIYDMLDVLEAINLTFYDSSFQKVSAFRFKVNNATSIGLYIYNGTDYVYNKSTSIIDYFPIIYEDSGVNNATIMFPGNAISNYKLLTNDIEYVSITIENGAVFQEYFNYFGNYNTLNYSSSALTGTINVQYGENIIDYYITDNIHNSEYRKVTVIKKYNLCKYDNFTTTTDPTFPAPDPNTIDPVYYIRTTLGVNLANYLIAMNLYEVGKNAIFMIFIFELFTMIIAGFITFQTLNITVPLFLSSFSGLIICLMVGYNYESLVFAIFLAIALSLMFSKAMVKGDSDA